MLITSAWLVPPRSVCGSSQTTCSTVQIDTSPSRLGIEWPHCHALTFSKLSEMKKKMLKGLYYRAYKGLYFLNMIIICRVYTCTSFQKPNIGNDSSCNGLCFSFSFVKTSLTGDNIKQNIYNLHYYFYRISPFAHTNLVPMNVEHRAR